MPKGSRVQDTINRLNVGSPAPHKRISLTPRGTESKLRAPRVSRAISRDDSALDALQPPPIRARNNSDPLSPRIRAPPKVPPRPPQPLVSKISKISKQFLQKFDSPLRNASSSLEKSNKAASKHASDLPQAQRRQHGRAANDSKKKKVGNLRSKTPPARAGERGGNKRSPPDLSRSGSQRLLMFRGEGEKSSSIASDENINDDYRTSDDGLPTPKCRPPPPPNIKQQKKKRPPALPSSTTEEQQYSSSSSSTSNGGGPRKKPPPIPASILLRKRSKNRLLPAAPANDSRSSSGANDAANIERTRHSSIYQGGNRERDSRLERVKTAPFLLGDSSCPPAPPRTRPARRGRGGQGNPPPLPMRRPTIHSKSQARGPPLPERRTKERKSIAPLQNLQRIPSLGGFDFDNSSSTSASGGGGNLSLSQRSTGFIGFAHYLARRSGKEHLTASNRVFYLNWAGTSSMMQCRFKQAARLGDDDGKDARGETLFSCIRLQSIGGGTVHKRGSVGGVVAEEWRYTNWDRQQAIASFDGVVFKTRLRSSADGKAAAGKELRFLNHNQERCRLEKQSMALLQFGGGGGAAGGVEVPEGGCESKAAATAAADTARMMRRTNKRMSGVMTITGREAKLPRYTFRETAQQIEKDRAIFAQMGVDSSQLAFDGLLKAEFGHRAKPGPCSTVRDVTRKVENLISSGTLAFEGGADLAKLLKLEGCTWREANHPEFLFIQYRVAGDPRSLAIPRKILQDEKRVYVGLKKLVPVVRLTCADLVDRLVEVPSSRLSENFFLTLPYHSAPDYVLHLLLKRTYPEIDSPWRPRIFAHLKAWIKEYPEDFCSNRSLVQELLEDAKEISKLTTAESAFHDKMSKRVLDAMENAMESLDLEESVPYYMYPTFLPRDEAKDYDDFSIHLLSQQQHVKDVAMEMTLIAQRRLQSLSGRDFIKKGYEGTSRNQMKISEHVARWVGTTVLLQQDVPKCVTTANRWLGVAKTCYFVNNFNSLFEIMVGLQQTPVARILKNQPQFDQKVLNELAAICAMTGNYKAYRAALKKQKGRPCVPYFGVLLRDMLCYEEAKPKIKTKFDDGTVWVNLKKIERMGQLVSDALLFKGNRYTQKSKPNILELLEHSLRSARDEDTLYNMSYKIKPRGT